MWAQEEPARWTLPLDTIVEPQEEYSALLKMRGEQLQGHCPSLPRACSARRLTMVQTMS
jgi:hypothetical protein